MKIGVSVHIADEMKLLGELTSKIDVNAQNVLIEMGDYCIFAAQRNLSPGRLQESIGSLDNEGIYILKLNSLIIGTIVPYSVLVERGVDHSWLIPKQPKEKGKWLRFYWEEVGHIVYAKQVKHPPMKAKWFMTRAAQETIRNASTIIEKAIK